MCQICIDTGFVRRNCVLKMCKFFEFLFVKKASMVANSFLYFLVLPRCIVAFLFVNIIFSDISEEIVFVESVPCVL